MVFRIGILPESSASGPAGNERATKLSINRNDMTERLSKDKTILHPFLVTPAAAFGLPVCRLGLASYMDSAIRPDDAFFALRRGVNFLN
jgi:hypothetical protein